MPADNFHTARAKSLLAHYLKFGVTALGVHWDSDNTAEVNEIIDSIIDASTAASPSPARQRRPPMIQSPASPTP